MLSRLFCCKFGATLYVSVLTIFTISNGTLKINVLYIYRRGRRPRRPEMNASQTGRPGGRPLQKAAGRFNL